ncbi:hypothetical protein [Miltoncostaea marina]|uniref:hypothetical protein n=1 Tax=Miltoncostaea marina TaxID=2843215 RepID=UPI001C3C7684|nr:hypothetical protein [Miltoncostaea marina]
MSARPPLRVGDVVGVPIGDGVVAATVIEDRGPLGPGGERVVRLALGAGAGPMAPGYRLELPVGRLVDPPPDWGALVDR